MSDAIVIEAGRQERNYWRDLWRYRELFYVLARRDIAMRYKQTAIGVARAMIRPLLMMVVFTIVFGRIAKLPSNGDAPYPLMVFSGKLPWVFFSTARQWGITQLDRECQSVLHVSPVGFSALDGVGGLGPYEGLGSSLCSLR